MLATVKHLPVWWYIHTFGNIKCNMSEILYTYSGLFMYILSVQIHTCTYCAAIITMKAVT